MISAEYEHENKDRSPNRSSMNIKDALYSQLFWRKPTSDLKVMAEAFMADYVGVFR